MTLRLAPLDASRRDAVRAVLEGSGAFSGEETGVALELFDERFGAGASDASDYDFVGAFDDDTLRGYACWGPTPATEGTYDLYWIAVDPGAQGAGCGTLLLSEVERRLANRRARMLVVETSSRPEYEGARAFYARRGYHEAARVRGFYAPLDDRIILTKRLLGADARGSGNP